MNIFEEAMKILKNKSKIRQLVSDLHADDVQKMIARLESVYLEMLEAEQAKVALLAEKQQVLDDIRGQLKELGLSVEDLSGVAALAADKPKRKYKVREKFNFEFEAENGEARQWHGATVGRKPAEFAAYLDRSGKKAEDCIVE